jgi:hypothetical protein
VKNNVVQIRRATFLDAYMAAQNDTQVPDWAVRATGITATMVLPQVLLSPLSGILFIVAFVACALVGISMGLLYSRFPYRIDSCVPTKELKPISSSTLSTPMAA